MRRFEAASYLSDILFDDSPEESSRLASLNLDARVLPSLRDQSAPSNLPFNREIQLAQAEGRSLHRAG